MQTHAVLTHPNSVIDVAAAAELRARATKPVDGLPACLSRTPSPSPPFLLLKKFKVVTDAGQSLSLGFEW